MEFSRRDTKVIKGIAIILMLYHHLFAFPDRIPKGVLYTSLFTIAGNTIAYWIGAFGKICVALFVFLGGYGTYISIQESTNKVDLLIAKKIKNLFIIYWKVFAIFIPVCILFNISRVPKNLEVFLWNFTGIKISYNGEWWFFTPYIFLLILFPMMKKFIDSKMGFWEKIFIIFLINTFIAFVIPTFTDFSWGKQLPSSLFWSKLVAALNLLPGFLVGCTCAKYNIISKIKEISLKGGGLFTPFMSLICIALIFYMRKKTGIIYDFVYAPLFSISCILTLQNRFLIKYIYPVLEKIGTKGTIIWLTHSFYCYMLCPKIIYAPRFSILIVIWLCLLSYLTAIIIQFFYNEIYKLYLYIDKIKIIDKL